MTILDDLNYGLGAFGIQIPQRIDFESWASTLAAKPMENTAKIVAVSSVMFLLAERGHNPKVRDIYDAMVYCSTCLSVGYADIFARTPVGKLIGTFLMTLGPSISGKATDGRVDPNAANVQEQILATLQAIAERLPASPPTVETLPVEPG